MALLAQQMPAFRALKLGRAHEEGNRIALRKSCYEENAPPDATASVMDLSNNATGAEIGAQNRKASEEELIAVVLQAIAEGRCKILRKNRHGDYLDASGKIIPPEAWKGKWENQRCLVPSDYAQ